MKNYLNNSSLIKKSLYTKPTIKMKSLKDSWPFLGTETGKILLILTIAILGHLLVLVVKYLYRTFSGKFEQKTTPKWKSVISLITSILVFTIYFAALGKILQEMGISLTTYIASASIIGLAVGFGSQGIVQDIISGITLVFSDLLDIGELVEIGGQTGYVESIGMRFIEIRNADNAKVFIPNRTISRVVNYSNGHIKYYFDIQTTADSEKNEQINKLIETLARNTQKQFPSVFTKPFELISELKTVENKRITRIIFKIWPGRNSILDSSFKQELLAGIKQIEPNYADWMIANSAEIE